MPPSTGSPYTWDSATVGSATARDPITGRAGPIGVLSHDLDHDGKLDVITANSIRQDIVVYRGMGDGTLGPPLAYGCRGVPSDLTSGDFNGDGELDVATANGPAHSIAVLLGRGDGTFEEAKLLEEPGRGPPKTLAPGDFNNDGHLDLIITRDPRTISLLLGKGDGTFEDSRTVFTPRCPNPHGLAVADFDGNGLVDFAVTSLGVNDVTVFLSEGGGSFGYSRLYRVGGDPRSVVAADFDGDGSVDLATADVEDGTLSVLIGDGDMGGMRPAITIPIRAGPTSLATGDLDNDGRVDLVTAHLDSHEAQTHLNRSELPISHDCNRNGTPDECDIEAGTSRDVDNDGLPDECGQPFQRADTNGNGEPRYQRPDSPAAPPVSRAGDPYRLRRRGGRERQRTTGDRRLDLHT